MIFINYFQNSIRQPIFTRQGNSYTKSEQPFNNFNSYKQNKKITLEEGFEIYTKGFLGQFKDTMKNIVKHPIKSLCCFYAITAGMILLPLIGIPSAVCGGILAIGFAGVAAGRFIYHGYKFSTNNENSSHNIAKYHLEQLGRDSFDLAISAPFVPKAVVNTQKFMKYGKLGFNKDLVNSILSKKDIPSKCAALIEGDKQLYRNINFKKALDKELAKIVDMTKDEKAAMKKDLLAFNILEKDIPNYVLTKLAQKDGITAIPNVRYTSMPKSTLGYVSENDCSIVLNNFKHPQMNDSLDNLVLIYKQTEGNTVHTRYKDIKTGKIYAESIDVNILNEYNSKCQIQKRLTPQAHSILTTIHEREHISQFARLIQMKGFDAINNLTPKGKQLYEAIIKQMPSLEPNSLEAIEAESLLSFPRNPTIINYIKRPFEIGARRAEYNIFDKPIFQKLNNIFEYINKNTKYSRTKNIIATDIRLESVQN